MWEETGTAPDQQTGGKWHYYRLGGNMFGFSGDRDWSAHVTYNKTTLILPDNQIVNNETHVTAHVTLTNKHNNTTQNIDVRYYYSGQNVWQNANALPEGSVRNYVTSGLQTVSGY